MVIYNHGSDGHRCRECLVKHNEFMMAAALPSLVNLLVFIWANVLELNAKTRSLIAKFVLGSSVSILASFVISLAICWLSELVALCLCSSCPFNCKNTIKLISCVVPWRIMTNRDGVVLNLVVYCCESLCLNSEVIVSM